VACLSQVGNPALAAGANAVAAMTAIHASGSRKKIFLMTAPNRPFLFDTEIPH
jgi:hypothetical protein